MFAPKLHRQVRSTLDARVSCLFTSMPRSTGVMHRKLAVGEAGDPLEREADAVADKVLSMREPVSTPITAGAHPAVRRQCAACGESAGSVPPIVHDVVRSPGRPLGESDRQFFAPRFGIDLSRVRIHDDATAGRSAQAVNAHAYTVGRDIAFAPGRYSPGTADGRRLLAHELAHVAQQGGTGPKDSLQRKESDPGEVRISVQSDCRDADARAAALAIAKAQRMLSGALDWFRNSSPENDVRLNALLRSRFQSASAPTRSAVHDRLARVSSVLEEAGKGNVNLPCVDGKNKECSEKKYYAYVRPHHGYEINLCPEFFRMNAEEQVWGIMHECCHLAGASGDTYIFSFGELDTAACFGDAAVAGSPLDNADSYVSFFYCLLKPGSVVHPAAAIK